MAQKIKVNDSLICIFNFIDTCETNIDYKELIQYVIQMESYKEFYLNYHIIRDYIIEHDAKINSEVVYETK